MALIDGMGAYFSTHNSLVPPPVAALFCCDRDCPLVDFYDIATKGNKSDFIFWKDRLVVLGGSNT